MTIFGDLEVSTPVEIPAGRAQVTTTLVDGVRRPAWVERAWERVREEVASGRQVFVVAPRIGTRSDEFEPGSPAGAGVLALASHLEAGPLSGLRLGVLHGQLPSDEKESTLAGCASGELDVLVAPTLIEVGIDVPNASMMMSGTPTASASASSTSCAGRIGRGEHSGVCLLVSHAERTPSWDRPRRWRPPATASSWRNSIRATPRGRAGRRAVGRALQPASAVLEHADPIISRARSLSGRWRRTRSAPRRVSPTRSPRPSS